MADTVFRTSTPPEVTTDTPKLPEPKPNDSPGVDRGGLEEPVEAERAEQSVLDALGVDDLLMNLADEDRSNLSEVSQYVLDILGKKGVIPTNTSISRALDDLRADMGLSEGAEPSVILDRIGGVVKAWKGLTFITNPAEKRSLFMKLARQPDSKSMNKLVYEEMERREVWN